MLEDGKVRPEGCICEPGSDINRYVQFENPPFRCVLSGLSKISPKTKKQGRGENQSSNLLQKCKGTYLKIKRL